MSDILTELRTQHTEPDEASNRDIYGLFEPEEEPEGDCDVDAFCSDDEPAKAEPTAPELEYLNARQLATKLNVSIKAVTKWTAARRIPACKMGRIWRYPRIEIEKRLLSGSLLYDKR
jgi:hypothetical protein